MSMFRASVLLIEDKATWRNLLGEALRSAGCQVIAAESLDQARREVHGRSFDFVVMDPWLGGKLEKEIGTSGGLTFLQELRTTKRQMPTIVVSATEDVHEVAQYTLAYGVRAFIPKNPWVRYAKLFSEAVADLLTLVEHISLDAHAARRVSMTEVLDNFMPCVARMATRARGKPGLPVDDEYDVQDILYVMLKPAWPDIVCEETTHKQAGRSSRVDFHIPSERIFLEVKRVRDRAHAKQVIDEIKIDVESYFVDEGCLTLYVFVFDPTLAVMDASRVMSELSGTRVIRGKPLDVKVIVTPR